MHPQNFTTNTATLVIDVQQGLCEGPDAAHDCPGTITRINVVTQRARAAGVPVFFIQHESGAGYLEHGSPAWQLASGLQVLAGDAFKAPAQIFTIDGLRVDWPDGFGLIRASNTTPVLVLRFEGQTEAALQRIEGEMLALLRSVKPDAQIQAAAH